VTLTSPTGDAVTLLNHAAVDVSTLSFDLANLPALLNHWGEPIAGEWLLTITDVANGTGGTLVSWSITHRP
jgi:subtilisin-like proprotein convertase family protein